MTPLRQKDRVTLVTGASRGIGRAVALGIAKEGGHVVALARTQGALEELDDAIREAGGAATLVPGDVRDGDSLDRLGAALHERWGRLDGLIANAGVLGVLTPAGHIDPKIWDEVMAVNLTANYRLIRALDPLLRASEAGRAVFISSGAAANPRAYWSAYAASKAGLEALVTSYAAETAKTALRVNTLNPGATRTAMRAKAMPGEDAASLPAPETVANAILELLDPRCTHHGERLHARDLAPSASDV